MDVWFDRRAAAHGANDALTLGPLRRFVAGLFGKRCSHSWTYTVIYVTETMTTPGRSCPRCERRQQWHDRYGWVNRDH